jgi:segregation and condensation protein B
MITAASLEALLFIYGEPIAIKKIATLLGGDVSEVTAAARALREALTKDERGLTLVEHEAELQLATKAIFGTLLQTILKAELNESLTPAALETLSIITYAGPVGRAEIDYIRGVNSSFIIRALLLRGLITREGDPARANAYLYVPSVLLLRHLGVGSTNELPEYERFRTLVAAIRPAAPAEKAATPAADA